MNNGKQSEQLLKVLGGHNASLDKTSKCRGLSEQPLYSGGHKAMQHELISQTMNYQPLLYKQWSKNGYVEKCCKFVKNYFFSIIILHAHFQYV